MREYETVVIVQPEISEEGNKAILDGLDEILEKHGDTRLSCEDMGKRKLAYEIRKFHKGHYYVLSFLGLGKSIRELERTMRLDESVLRFMTVVANERVDDIEARKAVAVEFEQEQEKRALEKAEREAEEARAREESDRQAEVEREEAAQRAAEAAAAAEAQASTSSDSSDAADSTDSAPATPVESEAAAPAKTEAAAPEASAKTEAAAPEAPKSAPEAAPTATAEAEAETTEEVERT